MSETLDYMAEAIRSAWQQIFRGEIYDYAKKLDLQNGYAVKGEFDINTARHLIWPLKAIRSDDVRLVSIRAAVQTLKSLLVDLCVPFWIEHDPGDTLWLFEDDPKAKLYADTRAMPLITSVPEIKELLEAVDRHDKTKTGIKFRHMNLALAGLNLGNVQSISWRRVIIDELWMHKSDGLVRQAKDRTKQYPDTKKILLLGQGGIEDDDADREHKQTVRFELHYRCPRCKRYQPFALARERTEKDFAAKANEDVSAAGLRHSRGPLKAGTFSGLSWDTNDVTHPNGRWNFEREGNVGTTAHHRCYYCDFRIEDEPDVRRALNDSYDYFIEGEEPCEQTRIKEPLPQHIGFTWPAEASMRVPYSELVTKYLRAKTLAEELSYKLPLQEFYQKDRGISWSENLEGEYRALVHEPYDVHSDWAEEAYRPMIVDCQKDLQKFYATVFAVALSGESRELERAECKSWQELEDLQRKKWKVKDQHVFVDCGYQMTKVLRECVKRGHVAQIKIGNKVKKVWACWTGMKGSGIELFRHRNPRTGLTEYKIFSETKFYNVNIGTKDRYPKAPWIEWSNLHCKDLLRDRRDQDPTAPKFLTLPDTLPASDPNSYFSQMRSEKRMEIWTTRGKRAIWMPIKQGRPNHRWDIGGMLMAFMGRIGIIGAEETQTEGNKDNEGIP